MDQESLNAAFAAFLSLAPGQRGLAVYVVFILAGGIFGACVVAIDACSVSLGGPSVLGLSYGWRTTPKVLIAWFIGSASVSFLGMIAHIFEPTPLAALLAAISWRTFLGKLLAMARPIRQTDQRTSGG